MQGLPADGICPLGRARGDARGKRPMSRKGVVAREIVVNDRVVGVALECEPDALDLLKDRLTKAEYDAGRWLQRTWHAGKLAPGHTRSTLSSADARGGGGISDERLEANDRLRPAMKAMGLRADYIVAVCCEGRRVRRSVGLEGLRNGLAALVKHLDEEGW